MSQTIKLVDKRQKKLIKEENNAHRNMCTISPVTRVVPNKKAKLSRRACRGKVFF